MRTYYDNPISMAEVSKLPNQHNAFDNVIVDDESVAAIDRIIETITPVKGGDCDDKKFFFVEVEDKSRRKKHWAHVCVGVYDGDGDFRFVSFYDRDSWINVCLATSKNVYEKRDEVKDYDKRSGGILQFLNRLNECLKEIVEKEIENPGAYAAYLEKNLPYEERSGIVLRRVYNRYAGDRGVSKYCTSEMRKMLVKHRFDTLGGYREDGCGMTMREYAHAWRVAYCGVYPDGEKCEDVDDIEFFTRSPKGSWIDRDTFDYDSPQAFSEWCAENSPFHCFDVVYARVHLYPGKDEKGWCLRPSMHEMPFIMEYLGMCNALENAGIRFSMYQADKILEVVDEEDVVSISPCEGRWSYLSESSIGSNEHLPVIGKEEGCVSRKDYNKLISQVCWDKVESFELK